jgi:hypothetical protein
MERGRPCGPHANDYSNVATELDTWNVKGIDTIQERKAKTELTTIIKGLLNSAADLDPGSGFYLTPGSGIQDG